MISSFIKEYWICIKHKSGQFGMLCFYIHTSRIMQGLIFGTAGPYWRSGTFFGRFEASCFIIVVILILALNDYWIKKLPKKEEVALMTQEEFEKPIE